MTSCREGGRTVTETLICGGGGFQNELIAQSVRLPDSSMDRLGISFGFFCRNRESSYNKIIFGIKSLHVSDSSSVHHQEFFHCTHSNGICHTGLLTACEQDLSLDPARKLSANLYDIYHCCVYSGETPDDGQRNCPKHVEFYSKNIFEKLVHLVRFIMTICHDAPSPGRQTKHLSRKNTDRIWGPHNPPFSGYWRPFSPEVKWPGSETERLAFVWCPKFTCVWSCTSSKDIHS